MYRGTKQDNSSVPNQEPVLAGVSDGTPLLVSMSYTLLFRLGAKQKFPGAHYYFIGECPRIRDFFIWIRIRRSVHIPLEYGSGLCIFSRFFCLFTY
jgi:hypothetical protein